MKTSIGSRAPGQEWPVSTIDIPKSVPQPEPRFRPTFSARTKPDRRPLRISTCDPLDPEPPKQNRSSILTSENHFKYPYDANALPKTTNRRSLIDSPPEILTDLSWPLSSSTSTQSSIWNHEKPLPPTPSRQRGLSFTRRTLPSTEEYPPSRRDRPQSWNPRCLTDSELDINLDRAILGSTRLTRSIDEDEEQQLNMQSIFNSLQITESPKQRNSMPITNGRYWPADDFREMPTQPQPPKEPTEQQKQRQTMMRVISDRGLNPPQFDTAPKHARYFVIKSYNVVFS
jgi:hypothetical protein